VRAQLRAELLKQRSTRTNLGLLAALLGFVLLAVLLHGLALPAEHLDTTSEQLTLVVGWGEKLGVLFAGLLGAMSITSEIRHGTIRPTFLVKPQRDRVGDLFEAVGDVSRFAPAVALVLLAIYAAAAAVAGSVATARRDVA
jgi:ABC-2 type transport system permease protein